MSYLTYSGTNMLVPGGTSSSEPFQAVHDEGTVDTGSFLNLKDATLGSPVFTLDLFAPAGQGQFLVSLDMDLSMYYWQQNVTPFDFGRGWTIELQPAAYVRPVGDWVISKLATSPFHARFLGTLILYAERALAPFSIKAGIRCATDQTKGQWMISSFRCETYFGAGRLALPRSGRSCAGNADEFVVVDLSELPVEDP